MKGTIIYYGGFSLPDKNASANRVVSNGKIFNKLGFNTVFLGADYSGKSDNVHKINDNMFEECHPQTAKQWLESMVSFKNLKHLANEYKDLKMVILYNVPFVTLLLAKKYFKKQGIEVIYDCTEWTQFTEGSAVKKIFKYADELFVRKFAHRVAVRVIVISKMMENAYGKNKSEYPLFYGYSLYFQQNSAFAFSIKSYTFFARGLLSSLSPARGLRASPMSIPCKRSTSFAAAYILHLQAHIA